MGNTSNKSLAPHSKAKREQDIGLDVWDIELDVWFDTVARIVARIVSVASPAVEDEE